MLSACRDLPSGDPLRVGAPHFATPESREVFRPLGEGGLGLPPKGALITAGCIAVEDFCKLRRSAEVLCTGPSGCPWGRRSAWLRGRDDRLWYKCCLRVARQRLLPRSPINTRYKFTSPPGMGRAATVAARTSTEGAAPLVAMPLSLLLWPGRRAALHHDRPAS